MTTVQPFQPYRLAVPKRLTRAGWFAGALCLALLPSAWAQNEQDKFKDGGSQWSMGLGAAMERRAYRDFDDKAQPIPILTYENKWISLGFPSIDIKLPSAGPVDFRLRARYANDGYEESDSPYLEGMDERKNSIWLGGAAIWRNDVANVSAEALVDGSGNSDGTRFKLQVDRRLAMGAWGFTPRAAVQIMDSRFVDYYYGVRPSEVRADRPQYSGESATNIELGFRTDYSFTSKQMVFLDMGTTLLGSGIKDSPLVERGQQAGARAGYVYRF
ncbi:MipA/OmpV family protein [Pseudomonas sp. KU26590]|uniref:MipA/OmpV family protein n=1 Tax=Pseudomonas sp. KU26590 TaxID=2991051 RepID=UPI00223D60A3|nr:MipA/OmpV family protein [Pseudomonas sp. KU26590]UZJ57948.1 MipA/OmpV family protein [Pseudomonas sp. KU26590]